MFDRIKKAFARDPGNAGFTNESLRLADGPVSEWAGAQGFAFAAGVQAGEPGERCNTPR